MLVIFPIAISVLMTRDSAPGFLLARGIGSLHVGAHLNDIEHAIAIPGTGYRFFDVWLAQDEFQGVSFRQLK